MSGCHVCGKSHGTRHYFNVCAPRYHAEKKRQQILAEMRELELKGLAFCDGAGI